MVEFALILPLLLLLTFGIIEFAVLLNANSSVAHAGRAGGRTAGISSLDPSLEYKAARAVANSLNASPGSVAGVPQICVGKYAPGQPCGTNSITLDMVQGDAGEATWEVKVPGYPTGTFPDDNWPVGDRQFGCNNEPFDRVVVRVWYERQLVVPGLFAIFFGNDDTPELSSTSVFQLEPVPSTACPPAP
jgi:hypothetical protein